MYMVIRTEMSLRMMNTKLNMQTIKLGIMEKV